MRYIFSIILVTLFCARAICQSPPPINFDELAVKDSTGAVLTKQQWQMLVGMGQYSLRIALDRKNATLVKLSEEDQKRREALMPGPSQSPFFRTGEKVSFSDRDITGTKWDLKKLQGKVVVLNFWFVNCSPCRMEIPELNKLVANYKDNNDVIFLAVALDSRSDIKEFLSNTPYDYHIISDGRPITSQYGITSYPTNVVLDRQGKVSFHTTGFSPKTVSVVKSSIDEALAKIYN